MYFDNIVEAIREHNSILIEENKHLRLRNNVLESELIQLKQILVLLQKEIEKIERRTHEQP